MRKHEKHVYISIYTWVEKHHIGILPSDKICAILCNSHWLVTNMPKDCNEIKHKYIISQKKERPLVRRNERWNNCTLKSIRFKRGDVSDGRGLTFTRFSWRSVASPRPGSTLQPAQLAYGEPSCKGTTQCYI